MALYNLTNEDNTSVISKVSIVALPILANCEKSPAIFDNWSICSINVTAMFSDSSFTLGAPFCIAFCKYWILSFIGVSGFLISCATCLAISRHAPSLSLCASACALISSFFTILLYSSTSIPISSLRFQSMASLIWPRFISCIFLPIKLKDAVIRLVKKNAIAPAIKKINAFRLIRVARNPDISWFSSLCELR